MKFSRATMKAGFFPPHTPSDFPLSMPSLRLLVCLVLLASITVSARAAAPPVALKSVAHPRLFFTQEDQRRIEGEREHDPEGRNS